MNYFKRISVNDADQILASRPEALLFDIRASHDFYEGHHPKANLLDERRLHKLLRARSKKTPILIYCYHGKSSQEIAQMLIDFGFEECYSVDGGYSAWCHQIESEFPSSSKLNSWLSSKGLPETDINARLNSSFETPLMQAARLGRADLVDDFIRCGADPNLKDSRGNNALWYACLGRSLDCVKLLINADVEVDNVNIYGFGALNYAVGMDDIFALIADSIVDDSILRLSLYKKQTHATQETACA